MKIFFSVLVLLATCIMISCHDTAQQTGAVSKDSLPTTGGATPSVTVLSAREKAIRALEQLQQDIASKNKEAIASHFSFPVSSDSLQLFDVNEAFDKEVEQHHLLISRQLFLTHFDALYENLELQGFTDLFYQLPLTKLKDTATKQLVANVKDGACIHLYVITIDANEITFQYGVYSNPDYKGKQSEASDECAEYAAFWTFTLQGEHLLFVNHDVAG